MNVCVCGAWKYMVCFIVWAEAVISEGKIRKNFFANRNSLVSNKAESDFDTVVIYGYTNITCVCM